MKDKSISSLKKNYLYNIIYQILILIIPLITSPYLSRVIGVDGIGIYSYRYSIVYYFMLFTLLGVNNYGSRTIAKVRDTDNLSVTFWSIYFLQLFFGFFMIILYNLYLFFFDIEYKLIAVIDNLFIISAIFDINWLFFGLEEFKKTVTRKTVIKILNIIFIFIFVKKSSDLWVYTLIVGCMTCCGQILMWFYLKNKIKFVKVSLKNIISHLKSNLILFVPIIAVSLYKIMDKIMLGYLAGVLEVGFYEQGERIVNIPLTIITSLGLVMLPRISNISAKGEKSQILKYIDKSINFVMFLSLPMCFGLITIGIKFAPLFYGVDFQKSGYIIMLLALTLPFLAFANVIRTQFLIPREMDLIYIKSVFLGAFVNFVFNLIFIPNYGSIGACIGTIFAEVSVMLFQTFSVSKYLNVKTYLNISLSYLIKSLIMFACIFPFNFCSLNSVFIIIIQVILGVCIYYFINFKFIMYDLNLNKYLLKIFRKKV